MEYFYQYGVYYYSDVEETEVYSQGILRASGFVDAISQLAQFYGEENIESIDYLTWTEAYGVLCLEELNEFQWKPQERKICDDDDF